MARKSIFLHEISIPVRTFSLWNQHVRHFSTFYVCKCTQLSVDASIHLLPETSRVFHRKEIRFVVSQLCAKAVIASECHGTAASSYLNVNRLDSTVRTCSACGVQETEMHLATICRSFQFFFHSKFCVSNNL